MADRNELTPETPATDLAALLRLHFEASRAELSGFLDQWVRNALGDAKTVAITIALAGLGGLFLLIALVLAIGDALDHVGWGLFIVGGALALGGGGYAFARFIADKNRPAQESE